LCNAISAQLNTDISLDSDKDNLSDLREGWWLCDPHNPDTNEDGIKDGDSVNYNSPYKTYPYRSESLDDTTDADHDGLPNSAEGNEIGTDFKTFSTDGDPYGDGQEYFNINIPNKGSTNHYFVAAYPKLNIEIFKIDIDPIYSLESKTGRILRNNWGIDEETTHKQGLDVGIQPTISIDPNELISNGGSNPMALGKALRIQIGGNLGWSDTSTVTKKNTASGWDQRDWSTVITKDPNKAAKIKIFLKISNVGNLPAKDVSFDLNLFLGNNLIETISIGNDKKILSLAPGESTERTISQDKNGELVVSLNEMRCIDTGVPLEIKPIDLDYKVSSWAMNHWDELSFPEYMNQMNETTATLLFKLGAKPDKEYRVYAGNSNKPITLREAMNLTIFKEDNEFDISSLYSITNDTMRLMVSPDAKKEILELNRTNKSIFDLKLKPRWIITFMRPEGNTRPIVYWAQISEDYSKISAAVYADDGISNVFAQFMTNGGNQNITLRPTFGNDVIFEASLDNKIIQKSKAAYIIALDHNNDSSNYSIDMNARSFEDEDYRIGVKHSGKYLEGSGIGQDFYVHQYECRNNQYQIWQLKRIEDNYYAIETYDNMLLEVDQGKKENNANVQLGKLDDNIKPYQKWRINSIGDGYYKISASHSNKYLTIDQSKETNGASAVQDSYKNSDNQKWLFQKASSYPDISSDNYTIVNIEANKALEVSIDRHNEISLFNYWYGENQKWILKPDGMGYFSIISVKDRKCIEANADKSLIMLSDFKGTDNQKWSFEKRSNNEYLIEPKNGKCLEWNENKVRISEYRGYSYQRWRLLRSENYTDSSYLIAENIGAQRYLIVEDKWLNENALLVDKNNAFNQDPANYANIQWKLEPAGDGHFKIINKWADMRYQNGENYDRYIWYNHPAYISYQTYYGGCIEYGSLKNEDKKYGEWRLEYLGDGRYAIGNIGDGSLCLTVVPDRCGDNFFTTSCNVYLLREWSARLKNNFNPYSQWRITFLN
jgi:hypothetical protein